MSKLRIYVLFIDQIQKNQCKQTLIRYAHICTHLLISDIWTCNLIRQNWLFFTTNLGRIVEKMFMKCRLFGQYYSQKVDIQFYYTLKNITTKNWSNLERKKIRSVFIKNFRGKLALKKYNLETKNNYITWRYTFCSLQSTKKYTFSNMNRHIVWWNLIRLDANNFTSIIVFVIVIIMCIDNPIITNFFRSCRKVRIRR